MENGVIEFIKNKFLFSPFRRDIFTRHKSKSYFIVTDEISTHIYVMDLQSGHNFTETKDNFSEKYKFYKRMIIYPWQLKHD